MTQASLSAEFTLPKRKKTDRRSPIRWLLSHTVHYWYLWIMLFMGAFGNAALAAVIPVYTGQAVDAVSASPPLVEALLPIALWIAGTQVVLHSFAVGDILDRAVRTEFPV